MNVHLPSRSHLKIGFKVWEDGECWFWVVVNLDSNGGTIGAAATEAEAIRDARSTIEYLSAHTPL